MKEKFLVFDTNYINIILNNKNNINRVTELQKDYDILINIATLVELVEQRINNKNMIFELMDFLNSAEIYVGDFKYYKCIEDKYFSFINFKIDCKKDRKKYFEPIRDKYYSFLCKFISVYLEWVLYALMELISEDLGGNYEYMEYLNKKSLSFQKIFRKLYNQSKIKVKDKFNEIIYDELKKMRNSNMSLNKELLEEIIRVFRNNEKNVMSVFHAETAVTKKAREEFVDYFFINEVKPFLDKNFNNTVFEKYIKNILQKLIIREGKMDPNDISDALILSSLDNNRGILVTNDKKMVKFLKENQLYNEKIYNMFCN